jgi:hypothetical protein
VPGSDRIYLEVGKRWVFACALDWPGWCRRAKGEEAAMDALVAYAPRYRVAIGPAFGFGKLEVIGRLEGSATTDFGAPAAIGPWDAEPLSTSELQRQLAVLDAAWRTFDAVVTAAPPALRKGPRGGGRDRDQVAEHVRGAERAYAARAGTRVPPRTPWAEQRALITGVLGRADANGAWPRRYALRRIAWHVLDHAWEVEDRSAASSS